MKINFKNNFPPYMNDAPEILRAFRPHIVLDTEAEENISAFLEFSPDEFCVTLTSDFADSVTERLCIEFKEDLNYKKLTKRFLKNLLYKYCSRITGIELPYGSLTGVRPTNLYYDLIGKTPNTREYMIENFFVSSERAELIERVVKNQTGIYNKDEKTVDIYVNIPFCPSRCAYCSFISTEFSRVAKRIGDYIKCLRYEIDGIKKTVMENGYKVSSVYVGGGTPTSLSAEQLTDALSGLSGFNTEFTVEAGRADSITVEKLDALYRLGVTRISVNPQTFNDETLKRLKRNHTAADVLRVYREARKYNFLINTDLIAGLPEETFDDFKRSLDIAVALSPDNITVHTLSLKRGADIKNSGAEKDVSGVVREMTDYSRETLYSHGYEPYYMYRQKNMADNLENVGYAKPYAACVYNIHYMEETNTVLSAGAGAATKYVYHKENRIERVYAPKGFNEYLDKFLPLTESLL